MQESHSITLEDNLASLNRQLFNLRKQLPSHAAFTLVPQKDGCQELTVRVTPESAGTNDRKLAHLSEESTLIGQYLEAFRRLTQREKEIVTWMVYDHSNAHIADKLCIARSTVETHRKNIKRKLGIRSHYRLVRFAQAFDLV
jgi:DNA-binding CsgD family transcriptional regulator